MRTWLLCVSMIVAILACAGCPPRNSPSQGGKIVDSNSIPSKVIVEIPNGQKFPQSLVGLWTCKDFGWVLEFQSDGRLASATIPLGRVAIAPGQRAEVPMVNGGRGIYEPGQWVVQYDPVSKELTVVIAMQSIDIAVANNRIVGKSRDVLVGQIQPGGTTWPVTWTAFPQYKASTDGGKTWKVLDAGAQANTGSSQNIIFEKATDDKSL